MIPRTEPSLRGYATLAAMECSWLHDLLLQPVPVVGPINVFAIWQPSLSCELSGFHYFPLHLETPDHFEIILVHYRVRIGYYFYWNLWWTKWQWERLFSQYFSFPLSVPFHHSPHTHPSIYHPRCIIFFSHYFSFPLSVSLHHCSILIHPSTTHAV